MEVKTRKRYEHFNIHPALEERATETPIATIFPHIHLIMIMSV